MFILKKRQTEDKPGQKTLLRARVKELQRGGVQLANSNVYLAVFFSFLYKFNQCLIQ